MSLKDRVKEATGDTPPPTTDIARQDEGLAWLQNHQTYFSDALPRHVDQQHFIATARSILPTLANCTNQSIIAALLACARFGLEPDGKQAAIIAYGKIATFQPMYLGLIDLMYRSGKVDSVHFNWIRERDRWRYTPSAPSPGDFSHEPAVDQTKEQRGPVVLGYAFAWLGAGRRSQVIILNREDAEEIRDKFSKAYRKAENNGKRDSTWHLHFDAMWAKSCVRRLTKVVPTSPELVELLRADEDADEGMSAPPVIRGSVISRDEEPAGPGTPDSDEESHGATWPEAKRPGADGPADEARQ